MRRPARTAASLLAATALLVGACGDEDEGATDPGSNATQETAAVGDAEPEAGDEPVAGCQQLDERPDATYPVGDAGEIEIAAEGSGVRVASTSPAEGWTVEEERTGAGGELEVTFRQDERQIDFEAQVVDGALQIEVCES